MGSETMIKLVMEEKKSEAAKLSVMDKEGEGELPVGEKLPVIDKKGDRVGGKRPKVDKEEGTGKMPVKQLQFCEELVGLVGPVDLETEFEGVKQCRFEFTLTPDQLKELEGPHRKIQLRFWAKNFKEYEDDFFYPVGLTLEVNGVVVQLPARPPIIIDSNTGLPKKPPMKPKPFDIKQFIITSTKISNNVELKWLQEKISDYVMFISIVKVHQVEELLDIVKKSRQPVEVTKELLAKMLQGSGYDSDIMYDRKNLRVPVICPIGMKRIELPCRGKSCKHLQCFDARTFLSLSEVRPTFKCPVCKEFLTISNLYIDEYFEGILCLLKNMGNVEDIEIKSGGIWQPIVTPTKPPSSQTCPPIKRRRIESFQSNGASQPVHPPPMLTRSRRAPHAFPPSAFPGLYQNLGFRMQNPTPNFQSIQLQSQLMYNMEQFQLMQMHGWQNYGKPFQNNGFNPYGQRPSTGHGLGRRPPVPTSMGPMNRGPSQSQVPVSTKPKPPPQIVDLIDSDEEIEKIIEASKE